MLCNMMYKSYICFATRQKIWFVFKINNKKIKFVKKIWREMRSDRGIIYVFSNWLLYSIPINDFLAPR